MRNQIIDSGISTNNFINDLCSFLNDCMLIKINKNNMTISLSEDLKIRIADNISLGYIDILKMLNMALNLSSRLKNLDNPKISLEVLIIKYVSMIKKSNNESIMEHPVINQKDEKVETKDLKKVSNDISSKPLEKDISNNINFNLSKEERSEEDSSNQETNLEDANIFEIIKSNWVSILKKVDIINSKLSSFLEETSIKDFNDNTLILSLENGNNFIKKVLDSDSKIITDIIEKDYKASVKIKIEVLTPNNTENKIEKDVAEEEHPLLDDAVKIFKGKMIS